MTEFNSLIVNSIDRITQDAVILSLKIKPDIKAISLFSRSICIFRARN